MLISNFVAKYLDGPLELPGLLVLFFGQFRDLESLRSSEIRSEMCFCLVNWADDFRATCFETLL
jgi:hypothetical protein